MFRVKRSEPGQQIVAPSPTQLMLFQVAEAFETPHKFHPGKSV
jgi:hypothetical protein